MLLWARTAPRHDEHLTAMWLGGDWMSISSDGHHPWAFTGKCDCRHHRSIILGSLGVGRGEARWPRVTTDMKERSQRLWASPPPQHVSVSYCLRCRHFPHFYMKEFYLRKMPSRDLEWLAHGHLVSDILAIAPGSWCVLTLEGAHVRSPLASHLRSQVSRLRLRIPPLCG